MKRTNVVVDEELLDNARRAMGERTYSATITRALEESVRRRQFDEAFEKFSALVASDQFFQPGYVEETWPEVAASRGRRRKVSASEQRAPKKGSRRGAR
jgi:hypothetical protein